MYSTIHCALFNVTTYVLGSFSAIEFIMTHLHVFYRLHRCTAIDATLAVYAIK